ncbi:GspH/FimT family protein [Catenovulum maritimum]|nr:GspH/FimT family protein [Catenovulum maritimum]
MTNKIYSKVGFTLLELIFILLIASLTLTLGIPKLQGVLIEHRVDNAIYKISKDIVLSRNYAIQYNTRVTMCHLSTTNDCDKDWQNGYSIFSDVNGDQHYNAAEDTLILIKNNFPSSDILIFSGGKALKYGPDGLLNGQSGTFRYCTNTSESEYFSRAVVINLTGRPRVSKDLNGDGKDQLNSNSESISCET